MELTEKDRAFLRKMKAHEATMTDYQKTLGWTSLEVGVYPGSIVKLVMMDLVVLTFKSHSSTNYMLTEAGRAAAEAELTEHAVVYTEPTLTTADMFSDIVGYDDVKELLRESLQLEKPIHVLLYGPPSLAKTMFLWDIERAGGEAAMWLIGSATSRAGLLDVVADKKPRWLLVDELEKMTLVDLAALLSLMEKGRLVRTKVGRRLDEKLTIWVVASANRIHKLPTELISRFAICRLTPYNALEFRNVVTSVLIKHEDTSQDAAAEIALGLVNKTHDVRDAVRVARLAKRVGVARAIELLVGRDRLVA